MLKFDMAVRYSHRDINQLGESESLELKRMDLNSDKTWGICNLQIVLRCGTRCEETLGRPKSPFGFFVNCYGKIQMNFLANQI